MCLSPDPPKIPVDFCISYSLQIFFACLFCFYMTTVKSSVVVIDWHQPCQVPTQLQLSTTDRKEKKKKQEKSVLWGSLLRSSALGSTWETQPCNQPIRKEDFSVFLSFFLSSFLSVILSFFLSSLPAFFLFFSPSFLTSKFLHCSSDSTCIPLFTLSPPLHIYTHMQTLLRKRGKGTGDRERKYECV